MKHFVVILLVAFSIHLLPSCKEVDTEGKSRIVQDSLNTVLPTWQALKIKVEDGGSQMSVIVGDATFYKATEEEKKTTAEELGRMILRIYGPGNYLEKGSLIVTADVRNTSETPADGISVPIDFSALKKEMH